MTDTPDDKRPETTDPAAPMPDPAARPEPSDGAPTETAPGATAGAADARPDGASQAASAVPDPFPPVVARIRTRWINPRRRWAVTLIAAGAAIVVFAGGVAVGFGIDHGDGVGPGRFHSWMDRGDMPGPDRMPWPGMGQRGPGMQQFPGNGQRRGPFFDPDQDDGSSSATPSPSSSPSPTPSPSSSAG